MRVNCLLFRGDPAFVEVDPMRRLATETRVGTCSIDSADAIASPCKLMTPLSERGVVVVESDNDVI